MQHDYYMVFVYSLISHLSLTSSSGLSVCLFIREGTLRTGDRVLSVNGVALNRQKHADALTLIMQSGHEAFFLIEYDIAVMGEQTRRRARACRHTSARSFAHRLSRGFN